MALLLQRRDGLGQLPALEEAHRAELEAGALLVVGRDRTCVRVTQRHKRSALGSAPRAPG